jgi:uncharacterized membrane-anchored protein YitT (DUF2179 family)
MPRSKQNINEYFVGDVVVLSDKLFHELHKSKIAIVVEKHDLTLYKVLIQSMDEPVWISYSNIKEVIYRQ